LTLVMRTFALMPAQNGRLRLRLMRNTG